MPEAQSDDGKPALPDLGDSLDDMTFEQILEMDDDDDEREFSKSIVYGFFEQAEETFEKMEDALESKDLTELYSLGHFLKGSSATLGLSKIRDECEKIQQLGQLRDEKDPSQAVKADECLKRISSIVKVLKAEYEHCKKELEIFYGESAEEDQDDGNDK